VVTLSDKFDVALVSIIFTKTVIADKRSHWVRGFESGQRHTCFCVVSYGVSLHPDGRTSFSN